MMRIVRGIGSSGAWAALAAVALFLLGVLAKSPILVAIGWFSMGAATLYAGFFSHDAKRAKAKQARIRAAKATPP
ncbi:hypothetical protein [Xanthomonas arboricola]|uniref:hypothetical protein n=1 Tax=Xanthomonas arboricola TaxID=56448 RepID=UPI0012693765|nr:hypothetical protein [Xanthomonas arboricola]